MLHNRCNALICGEHACTHFVFHFYIACVENNACTHFVFHFLHASIFYTNDRIALFYFACGIAKIYSHALADAK
jgi:hypothetical protein